MAKKKSMKKASRARSRGRGRKKAVKRSWFKRINWQFVTVLSGVLLVILAIYIAALDIQIRSQFEGKKWTLPARVYARPLELYPGLAIPKANLLQELKSLNYQEGIEQSGGYLQRGDTIYIGTRGFQFWDGYEQDRRLTVVFGYKAIESIIDRDSGQPLEIVRLEPLQVGSMYPAHREDRDLLKLHDTPELLRKALIAVEDRDFYQHRGIKPLSILRALIANIRAGATVQGGSTLTQQLVKNFFLSNERTLRRKAVEAIMAILLELHYDKDEILETYINEINLGQDGDRSIHGFALASRFYFDQPLEKLKPEQIALLIGIVKGPSFYNPHRNPDRATQRRNMVLDIMLREGLLEEHNTLRLRLSSLQIKSGFSSRHMSSNPNFMALVKQQLNRDYRDEDLKTEGLRIFTSLDPLIQSAAEKSLSNRLTNIEKYRKLPGGELQGAVVVTSIDSGEVVALIGDRQAGYAGFNRALDARRPIGSLIKPLVYLEALSHSALYNPVSIIDDTEFKVENKGGGVWKPENFDKKFHGRIPLYQGLINSYNVATARLGMMLGVENVLEKLQMLGLERDVPAFPSVLLGAVELSPYEVSQIYQALSANGFRVPLRAVRKVLTSDGLPLQSYELNIEQTVDTELVYMINSLLQLVVTEGTARSAGKQLAHLKAAGKTGTSDDLRDSWFAGFTGEHLAVVWVGRDDNRPSHLTGASGALPVWIGIMKEIQTRPLNIVKPPNVEWHTIDLESRYLSNGKCEKEIQLPFIIGTEPEQISECKGKSFLRRIFE